MKTKLWISVIYNVNLINFFLNKIDLGPDLKILYKNSYNSKTILNKIPFKIVNFLLQIANKKGYK